MRKLEKIAGQNVREWRTIYGYYGLHKWQYPKEPKRPDSGDGCFKGCLGGCLGGAIGMLFVPLFFIALTVLLVFLFK